MATRNADAVHTALDVRRTRLNRDVQIVPVSCAASTAEKRLISNAMNAVLTSCRQMWKLRMCDYEQNKSARVVVLLASVFSVAALFS